MILIYKPHDGEEQRFDIHPRMVRSSEAEAAERVSDMTFNDLLGGCENGKVPALRAMAWMCLRRADPSLRYSAFDPFADEVETEYSAEERQVYADQVIKQNPDLGEDDRALLDRYVAGDDPDEGAAEIPKDSTTDPSPTTG